MEPMVFVWLAIMLLAIFVEAAAPSLVSIWFVPGALCALIIALLGAPVWAQILMFLGVSIAALLLTRPLAKKWMAKRTATNADRVLGEKAVVTEAIDNTLGKGQAEVRGISWTARALEPDEKIPMGETVIVDRIEGVKIIVHKAE